MPYGSDEQSFGQMSFNGYVPAAVPSVTHGSLPRLGSVAEKNARLPATRGASAPPA